MVAEGCLWFILTYVTAPNAVGSYFTSLAAWEEQRFWKTFFPQSNNDYSLYINSMHLWRATERSWKYFFISHFKKPMRPIKEGLLPGRELDSKADN